MMATIFILSFFGYMGLLYILNWDILITIGMIFLFMGVWGFFVWWVEKKTKGDPRRKKMSETIEARKGINKNRVIDNLDDLDREFCKTWDRLLVLYKRIIIRAYAIKEEKENK